MASFWRVFGLSFSAFLVLGVRASTETLVAIRGRDFVVLGADGSFSRSLVLLKQSHRKVFPLGLAGDHANKAVAVCGDAADCVRLVESLDRELQLLEMSLGPSSGFGLGQHYRTPTRTAAQMARSQLLSARAQVDALIAGIDLGPTDGDTGAAAARARLLWLDRNGALQEMHSCAHGPSANLLLSLLDEEASEDMDVDAAVALVRRCFSQLRGRYLVNTVGHQIYVLDRNGLREVDLASASTGQGAVSRREAAVP